MGTSNKLFSPLDAMTHQNVESSEFPVAVQQTSTTIGDKNTDFVCMSFSDTIYILVTQRRKIGCMIRCVIENEECKISNLVHSRDTSLTNGVAHGISNILQKFGLNKTCVLSLAMDQSCTVSSDEAEKAYELYVSPILSTIEELIEKMK